jgi:3-hydroxyacyl-[acyl-carrier-protein] dehydratase
MPETQDHLLERLHETVGSTRLDQLPVEFGSDAISSLNPHRFEMMLLSAVVLFRPQASLIVGVKQLADDEFWTRGYSPGTATLPRVLMIECAGQLCSFYWQKTHPSDKRTFALGEIKCAKFYEDIVAGRCLMVVAQAIDMNRRKAEFNTAGFVDGQRAFDATIVGMALG